MSNDQEILHWRDLSSEEVYRIAYLEDEARDTFAAELGKVAFSDNYKQAIEDLAQDNALRRHEESAHEWLEANAKLRWLKAERFVSHFEELRDPGIDFRISSGWFIQQMEESPDLSIVELSKLSNITRATIHRLKSGGEIGVKSSRDIVVGLADAKGLIGKERRSFIDDSRPAEQ